MKNILYLTIAGLVLKALIPFLSWLLQAASIMLISPAALIIGMLTV